MFKNCFVASVTAGLLLLWPASGVAKTERERDGLIGLVQKVTTESGTWEKGDSIFVMTTIYDLAGNITESEIGRYKVENQVSTDKLRTIYERDPLGKTTVAKSFGADGTMTEKTLYAFDKRGNEIERTVYDKDGNLKFKFVQLYNAASLTVETRSYLHDGSLRSQSRYTYDQHGNMTSMSSLKGCVADQDCKIVEYTAANTYDAKGRKTESVIHKGDGTLDERKVYKYDEAGNLIEQATLNADGSLQEKERYMYKFDKVGNWTEKVTSRFTGNSSSKSVHKDRRTIIYFSASEKKS